MTDDERKAAGERGAAALVAAAAREPEELTTGARALLQPRGETVLGWSEPAPAAPAVPTATGPAAGASATLARPRGHQRINARATAAVAAARGLVERPGGLSPAGLHVALDAAAAVVGREAVEAVVVRMLGSMGPDDGDEDQGEAEDAAP